MSAELQIVLKSEESAAPQPAPASAPPPAPTLAQQPPPPAQQSAKPSLYGNQPQVLTEPPKRRFTTDQWQALGKDAYAAAKQMNMAPPEGVAEQEQSGGATQSARDSAKERLERRAEAKAVEQEMREQDKDYRAAQEVRDAYRENAAAIRELTEVSREEKLALSKMTQEERIGFLARKEADRQAEARAVKDRARAMGPAEAKEGFDPFKTAREHHEKKIRAEQVKAAHEEMYPEQKEQKSGLDAALDLAGKLRGTIGGTFGRLAGSMLDVVSAVRDASPKQPAKSAVRTEAERRNAAAREAVQERQAEGIPTAQHAPAIADIPVAQHAPPGATAPAPYIPVAKRAPAIPVAQHAPPGATAPAAQTVAKAVPAAAGAASAGAGAAGAAGAAMGLGALAAPVAIAAAASEAAKHLIRGAGDTAATLATLHDGADGLRATFGQMGGVVGEAANAIAKLDDAVKATADRLAQYSGELAAQQAMQEIAVVMRDIQRANRMGADVGQANAARFSMEQKLADLTDRVVPFIMRMSKGIFDATGGMLTVLGTLSKTGDTLVTAVPGGADFIAGVLGREFFPLTTAVVKLLQAVNAMKPEVAAETGWEDFIRAGNPFTAEAPQGAWVNAQPPLPGPVIQVP